MGEKENYGVSAIVPAYNEVTRIGAVLQTLTTCPYLQEVIVVDDGSTDGTADLVQKYPVRFFRQEKNRGKGAAMERGVQEAKHETLFFCDADIQGLTHDMIRQIVDPVQEGDVEMFIGMRNRKFYILRIVLAFVPLLGGERALTKKLWQTLPEYFKTRFRIEAGLNFYAKYYGKGLRFKVFRGVSQTIKEKKYGFVKGVLARLGMGRDYLQAQFRLEFMHMPAMIKNRRWALFGFISNIFGMLLGLFLLLPAYFGPKQFLFLLFGEKFYQNGNATVLQDIFYWVGLVGTDIIIILAAIIFFTNFFICLGNVKKIGKIILVYRHKWHLSPFTFKKFFSTDITGEKRS